MKITLEGDRVRLQLNEWKYGNVWKPLFDITVAKKDYPELKEHMIKSLEEFAVDE